MFDMVKLLKHKKTGKIHCPSCLEELKLTEEPTTLLCKKCKKYYGCPNEEVSTNE